MTTTPSASNVLSGKAAASGAVFRGTGTVPADATTAVPKTMLCLGYVGDSGLVEKVDRTTKKVKAWGGDTVKVVQTDHSVTFQFTLIEEGNPNVLKAVYGDENVETAPASTTKGTLHKILLNSKSLKTAAWDFEMADGPAVVRVFVPVGQVTSVGDVKYVDEDVIGYEVELEALPDATGNKAYKFIDLGDKTGA